MAASLTVSRLLIAPRSISTKAFSYSPLSLKPTTIHLKPLSSCKPISAANSLPDSTLSYLDTANDVQTLTKSKKTILFAIPGAFTPTKHVPGFVEKSAELKAKGVDTIVCVSVNDVFVMKAWKERAWGSGMRCLLNPSAYANCGEI